MDRNLVLAIALSAGVLVFWQMFILGPQQEAYQATQEAAAAAAEEAGLAGSSGAGDAPSGAAPSGPSGGDTAGLGGEVPTTSIASLADALGEGPGRIQISTPSVEGSINLSGGRLDDLSLVNYHMTVDPESPNIRLLEPRNAEHGHYVEHGWIANGKAGEGAAWSGDTNAVLTPQNPVTLTRREGDLVFEKTFAVDESFMFTVTQSVRNEGDEAESVTPYGLVVQRGIPEGAGKFMILHEGPMAIIGGKLAERKYKTLANKPEKRVDESGTGGWVAITNKYWLAAAIPPQNEEFAASLSNLGDKKSPIFRATYSLNARSIAPGETVSLTSHLFSGAKDFDVLAGYEDTVEDGGLGVLDFDKAIDWGKLFFLTRPIFYTLDFFGDKIGNFGVAILILTMIIKGILFPLANKAYETTSKMKKMQPQIEKLRERYKEDQQQMQKEMMALYQKEKMNPMAGCFPVILQMPIFYALYKTLFVTIEMRHQPFLYIKDLAAPDPTTMFNLFGLLPFDPMAIPVIGAFLGIGILPLLMGIGMWAQMQMNPPAQDPIQRQMFTLMPIIFTFLFAGFAAGLVLYWFWNTFLSIIQQWIIMKRNGVSVNWAEKIKLPGVGKKTEPDKAE